MTLDQYLANYAQRHNAFTNYIVTFLDTEAAFMEWDEAAQEGRVDVDQATGAQEALGEILQGLDSYATTIYGVSPGENLEGFNTSSLIVAYRAFMQPLVDEWEEEREVQQDENGGGEDENA